MRFYFFLILLFTQISQAKLTVLEVNGASNTSSDINGNTTIFGGTAFNTDDSTSECLNQEISADGLDKTCNSCTNNLQSCNTNRISDLLILQISFSVDSAPAPGPILITTEQDIEIEQSIYKDTEEVGPNQLAIAYIEWSEICSVHGSGFCNESPGSVTVKVGIDSDEDGKLSTEESGFVTIKIQNPNKDSDANFSTLDCSKAGACDFTVFSGNEKAFIGQIKKSSRFPFWKGSTFNTLKIFYSTEGFQQITPLSESFEININEDITLEEKFIFGPLNNNTQYYFRVAVVDEANNIAFITPDEQIQNTCGSTTSLTASQCDACSYCTRPANVVGILQKDLNCFISTATYESSQAPMVKLFRQFRNDILLKFKSGIWITQQYYKWGAQASLVIDKNPILKVFTKILLTPLAIIAWLSLHFKYLIVLLASLIFLMLIIFFTKKRKLSVLNLLILGIFFNTPIQKLKAKTPLYIKNRYFTSLKKNVAQYKFYSFQFGSYTPLNLQGESASYTDIYGSSKKIMLVLSYEKNIFSSFGLLSFEVGSGLMATTAYGLKEGSLTERSHEKLLFLLFPNHASLVYRFQYSSNPFISPYVKAGLTAFGILESPQSSGAQVKLALAPAGHIAAGLGINFINWSSSKKELQNDYNMHSFFVFAEYKIYKKLSNKLDLSNEVISVGLSLGF